VIVTFDPAMIDNVSVDVSATTLLCPATAIVVKLFVGVSVTCEVDPTTFHTVPV
jgi:hypothetical protein